MTKKEILKAARFATMKWELIADGQDEEIVTKQKPFSTLRAGCGFCELFDQTSDSCNITGCPIAIVVNRNGCPPLYYDTNACLGGTDASMKMYLLVATIEQELIENWDGYANSVQYPTPTGNHEK